MRSIVLLLLIGLTSLPALADDGSVTRSNAIAILAKPALPPDFPYFPYVNPNAPKGGEVTLSSVGTYDSFNPFILRGTSTRGMVSPWVILPGGSGSGSTVGHVWESLLTSSADEIRPATVTSPRPSSCPPTRCGSPSNCGRRRSSPTARRSPPRTSPGPSARCWNRAGRASASRWRT